MTACITKTQSINFGQLCRGHWIQNMGMGSVLGSPLFNIIQMQNTPHLKGLPGEA